MNYTARSPYYPFYFGMLRGNLIFQVRSKDFNEHCSIQSDCKNTNNFSFKKLIPDGAKAFAGKIVLILICGWSPATGLRNLSDSRLYGTRFC